jgi:uncharacterized HAD superfamily protein
MEMKKFICIDVDGVVADYEGQLNRVLTREFGQLAYCDRSIYSLEKRYEKNPVILSRALEYTADPNFYYPLRPIDPVVDFVVRISESSDILFLSSRPTAAETITARWLKRNVVSKFVLKCGVSDKADFLIGEGRIAFVVDDSPETISKIKDIGFVAICYDQQWNQGIFPRMYIRSDGEAMLWSDPSEESFPFLAEGETK